MKISVDSKIFEKWPDVKIGVVVLLGINNQNHNEEILKLLRAEEGKKKTELMGKDFNLLPEVAVWKKVYQDFGSNPHDYRSSVEALLRRVRTGNPLPQINNLVDLYNYLSIKFHIPAGAEDLDKVKGNIKLGFADGTETGKYIGSENIDTCYKGEVIYKDNIGFICRRWNWREADRTKIEENTKNTVLVFEAMPPVTDIVLNNVINESAELIKKYLGGEQQKFILAKENQVFDFSFISTQREGAKLVHPPGGLASHPVSMVAKPSFIFRHQKLGINNSLYAIIKNVSIDSVDFELEKLKQETLQDVLNYSEDFIKNNPTANGYTEILREFGKDNLIPAGKNLVQLIRSRHKFPTINTAVDSYNVIVAKSFLAIGAHDLDKVVGDVVFDFAKAGEKIPAVNIKDAFMVGEGDYVYRDQEKILAWLDVKDTDLAKIGKATKNILLMIEGTRQTSQEYILKYLEEACNLIIKFCGGEYVISKLTNGEVLTQASGKKILAGKQAKPVTKPWVEEKELPPKEFISYQIIQDLYSVVKKIYRNINLKPEDLHIDHPGDQERGDYTAYIAMHLVREIKTSPLTLANNIVDRFRKKLPKYLSKVEAVNPGFINFWLNNDYLLNGVEKILLEKENFGKCNYGKGKKVMIEYSQPNPNKPMHIGHARNNFLGMSLGEIYNHADYKTVRVNWINDRGVHIMKSMWGYLMFGIKDEKMRNINDKWQNRLNLWSKQPELWLTPSNIKEKPDFFVLNYYMSAEEAIEKDNHLEDQAREMLAEWENNNEKVLKIWQVMNNWAYEGWKITYEEERVEFDDWFYESSLYRHGKEIVLTNLNKGLFYKDANGSIKVSLKKYSLPDKVLLRSDGTSIYITPDLSLAEVKFKKYKIDKSVYVVGADQKLYFQQLFAILDLIGFANISQCYHLAYGMVYLPEGKMSSRKGRIILADDVLVELTKLATKVIEESKIGKGTEDKTHIAKQMALAALKYGMLKYNTLADIYFDTEKSITLSGESGPYLQYTFARAKSVLTKNLKLKTKNKNFKFSVFSFQLLPEELSILRTFYKFPEVVLSAAQNYAPNLVCNYLYDLAQKFNTFYGKLPILKAGDESGELRLKITKATAQVLKNGLYLLGIESPERM